MKRCKNCWCEQLCEWSSDTICDDYVNKEFMRDVLMYASFYMIEHGTIDDLRKMNRKLRKIKDMLDLYGE